MRKLRNICFPIIIGVFLLSACEQESAKARRSLFSDETPKMESLRIVANGASNVPGKNDIRQVSFDCYERTQHNHDFIFSYSVDGRRICETSYTKNFAHDVTESGEYYYYLDSDILAPYDGEDVWKQPLDRLNSGFQFKEKLVMASLSEPLLLFRLLDNSGSVHELYLEWPSSSTPEL